MRAIYSPLLFLILLSPLSLIAGSTLDTLITMSDGVDINVTLFRPDGPAPVGGFPGIITAHGFGGTKETNRSMATRYADSGIMVLAFTTRGQGYQGGASVSSGGVTNWLDDPRIKDDVEELFEWLAARDDVRRDRIAMEGISQGGIITWGALLRGIPFRCAVPVASVPVFRTTLAYNGTNNFFTVFLLDIAKNLGAIHFGPFLDSLQIAYQYDAHNEVLRLLDSREIPLSRVDTISVPIFAQLAWQDDLFSTDSLFRIFRQIEGPMKLTVYPGGHGNGKYDSYLQEQAIRFYQYWLKDDHDETIMHPDSLFSWFDPATEGLHATSREDFMEIFPGSDTGKGALSLYFNPGGSLEPTPPTGPLSVSRLYVQNVSDDAGIFRTEPLDQDVVITGGDFSFTGSSTASTWQVNILLFDLDPETNRRRPITRGSYQARDGGSERAVSYGLSRQVYTISAGHQIEAQVRYGMPLLKPDYEFGKTPYAPQATGITTFGGSPENPARLRLFLYPGTTVGVRERRASPLDLDLSLAWPSAQPVRHGQ